MKDLIFLKIDTNALMKDFSVQVLKTKSNRKCEILSMEK